MAEVVIHVPRQYVDRGWPASSASIEVEGKTFDVFFSASQGPLADNCDPFLPAALLVAMRLGVPLRVEGPVSPCLLAHARRIEEIIARWYDPFKVVPIHANVAESPVADGRGVGCFFSGGIDSFYSALKHTDQITQLVFVHGFDIKLTDTPLRTMVAAAMQGAAAELGKPLLEVETNLRELCDVYTDWNKDSHGAAMGCVALALAPQLHTLYLAATHTYEIDLPHGSSPMLDPLWSTEQVEVVHDGGETDRWRKLESMLDNKVVRKYLRSCFENRDGAYNCGHCKTCLHGMAVLRVNGVLDKFPVYPSSLDLDEVAQMPIAALGSNIFTTLLLEYVVEKGTDPALAQALRTALSADPGAEFWITGSPEVRLRMFRLNGKLQEAEGQLWTDEQRLNAATQRAVDLERQLEAAKARTPELERDLDEAKDRARELERQLEAAKARTRELERDLGEAKERTPELENQLAEAQARRQQAQAESQAARAVSAHLAAQVYRLTSSHSWRLTAPLRSLSSHTRKPEGKKA